MATRRYLITLEEVPGSGPYLRELAGSNQVIPDTPSPNLVSMWAANIDTGANVATRIQDLQDAINTAVTAAEVP